MPKKMHAALRRQGYSEETAYKIMNSKKRKAAGVTRKRKKK